MEKQIKEILNAIEDGGHVVDTMRIMDNLVNKLSDQAKMALADILNGFIKYDREVWNKLRLED